MVNGVNVWGMESLVNQENEGIIEVKEYDEKQKESDYQSVKREQNSSKYM